MSDAAHRPHLPEVRDEAADTPSWVPLLGLALLAVVALWMVARAHTSETQPPAPAEAAQAE